MKFVRFSDNSIKNLAGIKEINIKYLSETENYVLCFIWEDQEEPIEIYPTKDMAEYALSVFGNDLMNNDVVDAPLTAAKIRVQTEKATEKYKFLEGKV